MDGIHAEDQIPLIINILVQLLGMTLKYHKTYYD